MYELDRPCSISPLTVISCCRVSSTLLQVEASPDADAESDGFAAGDAIPFTFSNFLRRVSTWPKRSNKHEMSAQPRFIQHTFFSRFFRRCHRGTKVVRRGTMDLKEG